MIQHEQWQDNPVCGEARPVSASRGSGNQGRVQLPTLCTWADLCALAKRPSDSDISHEDYLALPKNRPKGTPKDIFVDTQGLRKARDPFILFGECLDGVRDDGHLLYRSAVTLDIDEDAADLLADLLVGMLVVPFAYVWHTTRSHTSDEPRLRVIIPLSRDVTLDEYRPLVVTLATYFRATLDPAAIKPSQMMYLPVRNSGAPYEWGSAANKGYAHPDHFLKLAVAPGTALAPAAKTDPQPRVSRDAFDAFLHGKERTDITLEQARKDLLAFKDPDISNDEWVMVGMALHFEATPDDEQEWLDLWDEWSALCDVRYSDGETAKRWKSFSREHPNARTLRSVIKEVQSSQKRAKYDRLAEWKDKIELVDDPVVLDDMAADIRADLLLDPITRNTLCTIYQKQVHKVMGAKLSITVVRTMLTPDPVRRDDSKMDWVDEHVWVTNENCFFNLVTKIELSTQSFNMLYDRHMPKDPLTGRITEHASEAASARWDIGHVTRLGYNPQAADLYTVDGVAYVNLYDPNAVPQMPDSLTSYEEDAVETVEKHLALLFADERERHIFKSWLAFVCQNPGVKVRWAPYLCGPEGDGKSFFDTLLGCAMGGKNVGTVKGSTFEKSDFTGWSIGKCVLSVEEMKLHGHNKFDAANMLKPYITNDMISVHKKGVDPYTDLNTTQYVIYSNYLDGVPITDSDRRFCFLRTRFSVQSIATFKEANPDYYDNLFDAVKNFPGAVRYWLMHFTDFHPDFKANGNAPITAMRQMVIDMSQSDVDTACQDVAREGAQGVTKAWVAAAAFVDAVQSRLGSDSGLSRSKIAGIVSQFLSSNGYQYMGGEKHRVGPNRVLTRFWRHESGGVTQEDWWSVAGPILEASYSDSGSASSQGFLD